MRQKLQAPQQFQIPTIPQMPQPQNINSTGPINKQPRGNIIVGSQQPRPPSVPNNEIQLEVNSPSGRVHTHFESQPSSPSLLPQVPQQVHPVETASKSKSQNNQNETIRHNSITKSVDGARDCSQSMNRQNSRGSMGRPRSLSINPTRGRSRSVKQF